MSLVYLAGPIKGITYEEATSWREYAREELALQGISVASPMREKTYLRSMGLMPDQLDSHPYSNGKAITTRDRFDVGRSDCVLANFLEAENVSMGTCVEFGWADAWNKPVVLVMEDDGENPHEHGMLDTIAGFRTSSLEEGIRMVKFILSTDSGAGESYQSAPVMMASS